MTRPLQVLVDNRPARGGRVVSRGNSLKDICPMKTAELFAENNNPPLLPSSTPPCLTTGPLPLHRGAH